MASPWTLEKELCGLAKTRSAHEALWRLGIIGEPVSEAVFEEVQAWTRDGAETFTATATVKTLWREPAAANQPGT